MQSACCGVCFLAFPSASGMCLIDVITFLREEFKERFYFGLHCVARLYQCGEGETAGEHLTAPWLGIEVPIMDYFTEAEEIKAGAH